MYSVPSGRFAIAKAKGAALIEFALTLPLFVAVLLAVIDFSNYLNDRSVLTAAAYNGAKAGANAVPCGKQSTAQAAVDDTLQDMLSVKGKVTMTPSPLSGPPKARRYVITVSFERDPSMMSLFTSNIDTLKTLSERGVAVCQE